MVWRGVHGSHTNYRCLQPQCSAKSILIPIYSRAYSPTLAGSTSPSRVYISPDSIPSTLALGAEGLDLPPFAENVSHPEKYLTSY
jgi:hypothetical protein